MLASELNCIMERRQQKVKINFKEETTMSGCCVTLQIIYAWIIKSNHSILSTYSMALWKFLKL